MSKRRLSNHQRKPRIGTSEAPVKLGAHLKVHRFIGVSLSGGKADKSCLAVLEYYPDHNKVFLTQLEEKIKSDEEISADLKIHEIISRYGKDVELVAFDAPLTLPKCMSCKLKCPGYENCKEPEIQWMWNWTEHRNKQKKPKKLFTPYTQRCVELHMMTELEEPFVMQHAMGANIAPLTARAHFMTRRLALKTIEVFSKASIWRLGRALKVSKIHLRFHKHAVGGDESRASILKSLTEHNVAFLYQQDIKQMVENSHAFEAFICALTAYLKFCSQTEPKPKDFPRDEGWVEFPKTEISWP